MFPTTTQERRRSWNNLTPNESWRPRSASTGVIEISPFGRSVNNGQRTPATPCFVSPRMAFSTQFNYDSPIQVLTSSSPCVFKPMSMRGFNKRCSLRRLPPRCKILLIVLCLSFAGSLYFIRSLKEASDGPLPCTGENCDATNHEHPSLQRFLGTVDQQPQYHSMTQDLDNPNVEMPNAPSLNHDFQYYETPGYQPYSVDGTPSEAGQNPMSNTNTRNKQVRVSGMYMESDHSENAVNTSTHVSVGSLLYHEPNSLEVQSIKTLEDLPLVQRAPESMMHERERRDLTTDDQGVQQGETKAFQAYVRQEESPYFDPQNSGREENVNVNSQSGNDVTFNVYSQDRPEETLNIPQNTQGENVYLYAQNGKQMGNPFSGPPRRFDETSNFLPQNRHTLQGNSQPQPLPSEWEMEARITKHYIPKENSGEGLQHSMDRSYQERPMPAGYRTGEMPYMRNEHFMYDEPPMERFPPGVNPRRYRNEF